MDRQPTLPTLDTGAAEEATMSTSYWTQGGEIKFGTERRARQYTGWLCVGLCLYPDCNKISALLHWITQKIKSQSLSIKVFSLYQHNTRQLRPGKKTSGWIKPSPGSWHAGPTLERLVRARLGPGVGEEGGDGLGGRHPGPLGPLSLTDRVHSRRLGSKHESQVIRMVLTWGK